MKNKKLLCSVCFLFTFMSVLWGQNITVKGNVTSKTDGQPIIGASVVQNDSKSTGTITDLDGNFTLSVPTNALLAISYIGYKEVIIAAKPSLKIVMEEDAKMIDEVVVTGYMAEKKASLTGERTSMNVTLAYEGRFGFEAVLRINVGAANQGLMANLFYYNESTGELEFISAGEVDAEGFADLSFTHASDYTIVLDEASMEEAVTADTTGAAGSDGAESAETASEDSVKDNSDKGCLDSSLYFLLCMLAACTGNLNRNGFRFIAALICPVIDCRCRSYITTSAIIFYQCFCRIRIIPFPALWQLHTADRLTGMCHVHFTARHKRCSLCLINRYCHTACHCLIGSSILRCKEILKGLISKIGKLRRRRLTIQM